MEFQLNTAYFPFTELNPQHPASYRYPEETAPAPTMDLRMGMVFDRCDYTTNLPTDPPIEPTAPSLAETLQTTQVPQAPIPYIPFEPLWSYPGWQPASPPEFKCWVYRTDRWLQTGFSFGASMVNPGGSLHTGVGASLDFVQDDRAQAPVASRHPPRVLV